MVSVFNLFRDRPAKPVKKDYGFTACGSCTTEHTPACYKVDAEVAQMHGLDINDRDDRNFIARLKAKHLTSTGPS
jgi:hypothetical protein